MIFGAPPVIKCYSSILKFFALSVISFTFIWILFWNIRFDYIGNEVNPVILEQYRNQVEFRKQWLKKVPNEQKNYFLLYNILVPEVFCRNLLRIGRVTDGGKWMCNPNAMQSLPQCVIYSLGIFNDPSFEEDIQKFLNNKCQIRSVDKNEQFLKTMKRIRKFNGNFMKTRISKSTNETRGEYQLKDVMSKFGDTKIDILKIDIEGAEFEIIDELVKIPICQILIEIHGQTALKTLELLQKFSKSGFLLFSYEINGGNHVVSEYSFIHESCLADYQVNTIYGKYLT